MDKLLKEFELLSLPSRVNLESLSENCIDKTLENFNLFHVFEALKAKGSNATPFQWRKLREACIISKSAEIDFIIEVYEEAFMFNLKREEMAECHISISKLIDFYCERKKFNTRILGLIILFRYYYTEDGSTEVASLLENKIAIEIIKDDHIQSVLRICSLDQNYWLIKESVDRFDELEKLLISLIAERSKKMFTFNILKSYPIISVSWIKTLLNIESYNAIKVQELLKEETGQLIELNETKDKFIIKKRKQ